MKAYINAHGIISPQHTFDGAFFENGPEEYNQPQMHCIEPDYKEFINPAKLRRMSRILKMGLGAASLCVQRGTQPDAIILGTGFGCLADLEKFQYAMKAENEQLLSPTPFVNSSHNMISSQIAIALGCNGYNMTHFHAALSFENTVQDAMMLIAEDEVQNVLVGGIDEITEQLFSITDKLNIWRKDNYNNMNLFNGTHRGTLMGEGAAFFILGSKPTDGHSAQIIGTHTFIDSNTDIIGEATDFLATLNLTLADIDTMILGRNGDAENDCVYDALENCTQANIVHYKHLCGEYRTSSAFAMWLGANILQRQQIPQCTIKRQSRKNSYSNILIYNHLNSTEHAFTVLSK
ncbi:MAG: beta-ketoacyl synthase chain length factor [Salinivirgaceae bacterium]|nr:beta-ketoacyl synthase chain length factor [Salinivirgaceae bacterium]